MSTESDFSELIARARAKDQDACAELMRRYGDELLSIARTRLLRTGSIDRARPSDVVNSVMGPFFDRLQKGHFQFDTPNDFLKLLTVMLGRKARDYGRPPKPIPLSEAKAADPASSGPSPSAPVVNKELAELARVKMTPEEQELVKLRLDEKLSFREIGARLGITEAAADKRFHRLMNDLRERMGKGGDHG